MQCCISLTFVVVLCKEIFDSYPPMSVSSSKVLLKLMVPLQNKLPAHKLYKADISVYLPYLLFVGTGAAVYGRLLLPPLLA